MLTRATMQRSRISAPWRIASGHVHDQGAVLCADLAALDAEAAIDAVWPIGVRAGVDRHGAASADADAQPRAALNQHIGHAGVGCGP